MGHRRRGPPIDRADLPQRKEHLGELGSRKQSGQEQGGSRKSILYVYENPRAGA